MSYVSSTCRGTRWSAARTVSVLVVGAAVIAALFAIGAKPPAAAGAKPPGAADPAVVAAWNHIAVSTITSAPPDGVGANAKNFINFAFVQAAVYNAVNGITREYELYEWHHYGPPAASPSRGGSCGSSGFDDYFGDSPTVAANLDAALVKSSRQSRMACRRKWASHTASRQPTGSSSFGKTTAAWPRSRSTCCLRPVSQQPTPPGLAPFFDPWLGQVDPLVLDSLSQFRPGPPPAIASPLYVEEFEEVRDYGVNMNSLRSPDQTETALFFSDTAGGAMQAALRDLVTRQGFGHQRQRTPLRGGRSKHRGRDRHRLGRQVLLRPVAPDHRHTRGRYRRQFQHRRR